MKYLSVITSVLLVALGVGSANAQGYSDYTCRYKSDKYNLTGQAEFDYLEPMDKYIKTVVVDDDRKTVAVLKPTLHAGKLMLTEPTGSKWSDEFIILTAVLDLKSLEFVQYTISVSDKVDVQEMVGFCIER